jgi:hypothetical protein
MAIGNAFDILPAQKVVTLSPRNPTASDISVRAVRRPWTQQEANRFAPGGANFGPDVCVFMLKSVTTSGASYTPRGDWLLTDANSNVWTILQVIRELEDTSGPQIYRCAVVKQVS